MSLPIGSQKVTEDGAVGTSGKKITVYDFIVRAGGSDTVVSVYSGTSASGTLMETINCAADTTARIAYPEGLYFDSGCFVDVDANTSFVTVIFTQQNA